VAVRAAPAAISLVLVGAPAAFWKVAQPRHAPGVGASRAERFIPEAFFGFVMRARRRFLPISCRHSRCRPSVDGIYDIHYKESTRGGAQKARSAQFEEELRTRDIRFLGGTP